MLVLETTAPGGQAGTSSKIENYLGFPTGISGQALAGRALVQAQKFGADVAVAEHGRAPALRPAPVPDRARERPRRARADDRRRDRRRVPAARDREPVALRRRGRLLRGDATSRRRSARARRSIVVGGGNSAGQAAVFLASGCRHVHLLVRVVGAGGEHVALPDPAHRGEPEHHAASVHRDHGARRERAARAGHLAQRADAASARRARSGTCS